MFFPQRHQRAQAREAAKKQDRTHRPLPSLTFTKDEITQIDEYRADNKSWKWIAENMGTTRRRLGQARARGLFAEGVEPPAGPEPFSDEKISQIKQYRAEEKTWDWIAKETGTSLKRLRRATEQGIFGEVAVSFSHRKVITDKQISLVKQYCAEGRTWKWISSEVKLSKWRLMKNAAEGLFGEEGEKKRPVCPPHIVFTEDQRREIIEYRIQRKSWDWIAIKMGVSSKTLRSRAREGQFGVQEDLRIERNE